MKTTTVYISIGNSDDKITQAEWSQYVNAVRAPLRSVAAAIHGEWYSATESQYQNACFCVELYEGSVGVIRQELAEVRRIYRQDSLSWAVAATEFI